MTGRAVMFAAALLALSHVSAVHCISLPHLVRGISRSKAAPILGVRASSRTDANFLSDVGPAGIAMAGRQGLFDYSIGVALSFLSQKLQGLNVPDVSKTFSIPIVGSFQLQLINIVVTRFTCSPSSANLTILGDGFFHLLATDIAANLTFQWHWTKGGLSGSGDGELLLEGGTIDWVYDVHKDEQLQKPQLQVVTANSNFDLVELKIHSYSADWLYQAILSLFNEAVKRQVQNGVASALDNDVPDRINSVLGSLPTRLDVRGLPFSASFEYSIYTAAFVLVKGFGEVEVPAAAAAPQRRRRQLRRLADVEPAASSVAQMTECPFETSPLPMNGDSIGTDPRMISIYVHEATVNCLLWGLYRSGKLAFSLKDGSIPGLTITTDILAMLVPELPTLYPHQRMIINVEALDSPRLAFIPDNGGTTITAYYRLSLVVANETLSNPEMVRLAANLTLTGAFDWDTTTIAEVTAHHVVESSVLSVPAEQWDNTVMWLIQNYGGMLSLRQLVDVVVRTPIASLVSLDNVQAVTWDRWYAMSADVALRLPPPPPAASNVVV